MHAVERLADGSLVAGTGLGVVSAGANGERWSPIGNELAHHRMFSVLATGDGAVLAGSYEGVWTWRPGQADWTALDTGLDVGAVFGVAVIDDVAYVGGPAGAFRSDDRGDTWEQIRPAGQRGNVYSFCRTSDRLMVATDDGLWDAGSGRQGEPWHRAGLDGKRVYTLVERRARASPRRDVERRRLEPAGRNGPVAPLHRRARRRPGVRSAAVGT